MIGLQVTVSEVAWTLLKKYLTKYEEAGSTKLHNVVCKRILLMKYFLPHWLYASYRVSTFVSWFVFLFICGLIL